MKERAGETGADATPARTHRNALTPVRRRAPSARQPERLDLSASGLGPLGVHQRATSEILSVVATSSGESEPAFETLLGNVTRLCQAKFGILHLREGDNFRMAAAHAAPQAYVEWRRRQPLIGVNDFPHLPRSLLPILLMLGTCFLGAPRAQADFLQTDLVSDIPGLAALTDPELHNPWGMSHTATSPFWTSNQGTNTTTLFAVTPDNNVTKAAPLNTN